MTEHIKVTPEDAQLYVNRLIKTCELRQSIDAGDLSSSKKWGTDNAIDPTVYADPKTGETKVKKIVTQMPIYPDGKSREKGLRAGVMFCIYSDWSMLHQMGLGEEADMIVEFDSTMAGGKKRKKSE